MILPNTSLGITYPDSSGHARLWEHLQALADTVNAAIVAARTPPLLIARRVANQPIPTGGVGQNIFWDTEDYDNSGMLSITSDTITIKVAGKYQVDAYGILPGTSQVVQVNHGAVIRARHDQMPSGYWQLRTPAFIAAVNDVITIGAFQSSAGAQNLTAAVSVMKVSD